jgi:ABC-type uncharacterized transport system involved in gliding motility auxiliary subunit
MVAFLMLVVSVAIKFMTELWLPINTLLLAIGFAFVIVAVALDHKLYWEFLTMRTTKHGMNMGALILVVFVLLVCVNYLASLHNKSWDVTQEKLNSLSDESANLIKGLKDDIEVKVFSKGNAPTEKKQEIHQTLNLYTDTSSHVKVRFVNPYIENDLAIQYLNDLPDRETAHTFVFVEHAGRRIRAEMPFDEAAITGAMIKATRQGESKIYFVQGHGEKEINGEGDQSVRDLSHSLGESSFKVESLNLLDKKAIPADATVIAIVGPSAQFLDAEIGWLREYMKNGGRLFLALDPGQHTNLANLTKSLGIEFENNYVVTLAPIVGGGPALILGNSFDRTSEITKNFPAGTSYSLFYLASEVKPAPDKAPGIQTQELVKADKYTFTLNDLRQKLTSKPETKPVTVAVSAKGKLDDKEGKEFQAVVFGDSDFLSNRSLMVGVNRDLAMNSFASLAEQKDLLSIRPKMPKGTMLMLTGIAKFGIVIAGLTLPILLLITSGIVWFRRRGA